MALGHQRHFTGQPLHGNAKSFCSSYTLCNYNTVKSKNGTIIASSSQQNEFHNDHGRRPEWNTRYPLAQGSFSEQNMMVPDSVPVVSQQDDWREFRAKLVKSSERNTVFIGDAEYNEDSASSDAECVQDHWAHMLAHPEKGCLLLANPLMFTTAQTYFNKSVILVFSHGIDGSAGIILNKPTQHVMKQFKDASTLSDAYDDCTLYLGGDVGPQVLNILHNIDGLEDSDEIVPGVYLGGVHGLADALQCGKANTSDVKLLTRYAGWGPGQLEEEVKAGVWIVAAASRDIIMGRYSTNQRATRGGTIAHGDDAWHGVLQLMGGEYAALSDAVSEEYRADIMEPPNFRSEGDKDVSSDRDHQQGRDRGDDDFLGHGI